MRTPTVLFFYLITLSVFSQKGRYLDREIQIEADNDAFTMNWTLDQYYSQGSYGKYRVVDTTGFRKRILWVGLNHRIFTTRGVSFKEVEKFDRPYAGQLSASAGVAWYDERSFYEYIFEAGVMGPASLAEPIQTGWHKFFGMPRPEGWDYQLNNSPILNGYANTAHLLVRAGNVQIIGEGHVAAGTAFMYARPEVLFRLGKFKNLEESVQYGANLGHRQKKSQQTVETILFFAYGPEYVFYNSTIEGNFIGTPSIHTEEIENLVHQYRIGMLFSWSSFDLSFIYYRRSVETKGALNHRYVGIRLGQRF